MNSSSAHRTATDNADAEISAVIINWNSHSLLRKCVAALDQSTIAEQLRVTIVDNASSDRSIENLKAKKIRLTMICNSDNRGFAAAANQGAAGSPSKYLLFLNPDLYVRPETIELAKAYLEHPGHSKVGILGVQLIDSIGKVWRCCARQPTTLALLLGSTFLDRLIPALIPPHFMLEWDHCSTRAVYQIPGAFLMIRRSLFDHINGFDERFFLYYEDLDLCTAAQEAGWSVVHFAGATAVHIGGGTTQAIMDRRLYYVAVSRVAYTAKHHGRIAAIASAILTLMCEFPIRSVREIFKGRFSAAASIIRMATHFPRGIWPILNQTSGNI